MGSTPKGYISPTVLASMYGITGTGNGYGSQAVYESQSQSFLATDLAKFQSSYSQASYPVSTYIGSFPSSDVCKKTLSKCSEASLDVQYIMGVGQLVPTTYHYDGSSDGSFLTFLLNVSNSAAPASVYSISYGAYEKDISSTNIKLFNTEAMKLGIRGVTLIASSGDDGVSGYNFYSSTSLSLCGYYAQWPASSPYVTAVGGTMNGKALTGTAEIACSTDTGASITSGGGFSNAIAAPDFQAAAIASYTAQYSAVQSSYKAYNTSNRGYPDVSMPANNYIFIINGSTVVGGGTSASAPVFAGLVSLVNSVRLQNGLSTLGWLNPTIYM
jgi:tripeptidyl-peptidase-1